MTMKQMEQVIDDDEKLIRELWGLTARPSTEWSWISDSSLISISKKLLALDRINRPRVIDEE